MIRNFVRASRVAACASFLVPSICMAAAGDVDTTFGVGGRYVYPRPGQSGFSYQGYETRQIVPLSNGGGLALGGVNHGGISSPSYRSSASFALRDGGVLDTSYANNGTLEYVSPPTRRFVAARELADGKVMLVSEVTVC